MKINNVDPSVMQMYLQQAQVEVASYEFQTIVCVVIGLFLLSILGLILKFTEKDEYDGTRNIALGILGVASIVWAILFITTLAGYTNYITAKTNPDYWVYRRLLHILGLF